MATYGIGTRLTADGNILNHQYAPYTRYGDINLSSIYTALIQEAGRWCESYASDLLIDIDGVKNALEKIDDWKDLKNYEEVDGRETVYFKFGFRQDGVDHKEFIDIRSKEEAKKYYYYRSIWELRISKTESFGGNGLQAVLHRIA